MAGVAVVGSGNYELFIDTGFLQDAFTLDDATEGVLDNTTYVLDGTTNFAGVLDGCTNVSVRRGRQDQGDQFAPGTMSFQMLDTSGIFNPFDQDSPYWDETTQQPGLAPLRRVKLQRYDATNTAQDIFNGYIINYMYNFALGGLDTVTVFCADQFYLLAQTVMDEFNVHEELSSTRLEAVLDLPEVAFPIAQRDIETGTVTLGGSSPYTVPQGTNVSQYCSEINRAEQGRLFMTRSGDLRFEPRIGNTLSAPVASFHDDGTQIKFNGVGISFEADQVVNRATVTIAGSNSPQTADDPASQATYFVQAVNISGSLLHNDAAALELANYLLVPEPEPRYTSVETQFNMLTTAQKDVLAIIEIGNTITIEKTINNTQLAQELAIEGIEHYLSFDAGHSIRLFTSPTTVVYELILDDAIYGIIDALNVLG
jgi:hypothetical protein